jgi:4-alpha-glucanotransferase
MTGELHNAIIGFLATSPSQLLLVNQEDLAKETEQQNLPGSTAEYPNWRRKMRYSIEELNTNRLSRDYAAMVRGWLEKTGRVK